MNKHVKRSIDRLESISTLHGIGSEAQHELAIDVLLELLSDILPNEEDADTLIRAFKGVSL